MPTADLIFKNADVITVDAKQPGAEFVAVKGDKIIFAGSKDFLNDFTGPGTKFIDCAGKTLLPGFNDAHCHIFSFLRKLTCYRPQCTGDKIHPGYSGGNKSESG